MLGLQLKKFGTGVVWSSVGEDGVRLGWDQPGEAGGAAKKLTPPVSFVLVTDRSQLDVAKPVGN
jgi:hypothetical protein